MKIFKNVIFKTMPPFDPIGGKKNVDERKDILDNFVEHQKLQTDMIIDVIYNTIKNEYKKKSKEKTTS